MKNLYFYMSNKTLISLYLLASWYHLFSVYVYFCHFHLQRFFSFLLSPISCFLFDYSSFCIHFAFYSHESLICIMYYIFLFIYVHYLLVWFLFQTKCSHASILCFFYFEPTDSILMGHINFLRDFFFFLVLIT